MRNTNRDTALWLSIYVGVVVVPLAIAGTGDVPPGRGFWMEFAVALGFVGLAMMWLQFALTARFQWIAPTFGLDTLMQFHRQAGLVAFALVLSHPIILFAVDTNYLNYLNPFDEFLRAGALLGVTGALVLLIGTTLWRTNLGLPYEWWRAGHALLALFVVFVGLVHILRVGFFISEPWKQGLWILLTAAAMGLLVHTRLLRPWRMLKKPYRVTEVTTEPGNSWTLTVEPEGHEGLRFEPGQFAWLTLGDSPFALEQHPFSFSSSAEEPQRLSFTIKALGDFSSQAGETPPGTQAYIDGPYGAFTLDDGARHGAVFIAGGVGITPVMSILRTLRDRGDERPLTLIYGIGALESAVFREELEAMQAGLNLELIFVPRHAPDGWEGERGAISADLLDRCLPPDNERTLRYLVCGPPPMMDIVEAYLRKRGVPSRHINAERFDIA